MLRTICAFLLLVGAVMQVGCGAVAGGVIGGVIGHEAAEEDDEDND